jgi:hypothetical protein
LSFLSNPPVIEQKKKNNNLPQARLLLFCNKPVFCGFFAKITCPVVITLLIFPSHGFALST